MHLRNYVKVGKQQYLVSTKDKGNSYNTVVFDSKYNIISSVITDTTDIHYTTVIRLQNTYVCGGRK